MDGFVKYLYSRCKESLQTLFEHQGEDSHIIIALFQDQGAVMFHHDLFGEAQSDAGAIGFGGVEGHENLFDLSQGDGLAVVGHSDDGLIVDIEVRSDSDGGGSCLYCILNQVVEHLHDLAFIGEDEQVRGLGLIGQGGTLFGDFSFVEA